MADGSIRITIDVDGRDVVVASKDLGGLEAAGRRAGGGARQAEDGLKGVGKESPRASGGIKTFAASLGLVAIGAAAFRVLKASLDDAIARFDTLNKFPKVLQSLGVSADDSERAMTRLSDGIDGLPTKLDEIASTAQRMYTSFGDMDTATDSALALNNALLASGANAGQAQRGTEQYLKSLQTGKMYLSTWNTLQETMDVGLVKVAEGFGFAGRSAKDDLYSALKDGSITLDEFNDKLVELGTGTGELADLARTNSAGIATSLSNLKVAAARGIADILESLNKLSKDTTGKELSEHIDSLKRVVNASFKVIGRVIERAAPIVRGFIGVVRSLAPVVSALTPAIIGLMAAYGAYVVISKASAAMQAATAILKAAQASTAGLTLALNLKTAAEGASTAATVAGTVARAAQTGAVSLSTLAIGVMTGAISISTVVQTIATAASYALGAAIQFMLGPIGWVILAIGLLVMAITAIVKWFQRSTAEANRLNDETEELGQATEELADSVDDSSGAYKKNQREIKSSAKANQELARKVEDLAKKENKSAADKKLLQSYIEELNGSVEGLNLAYDAEADALNMSSGEMSARIGLMGEAASYNSALERQTEITREQIEIEEQLGEINELRDEWNQKLIEGSVKLWQNKKAVADLNKQEAELKETNAELSEQYTETEEQITASQEAIAEAIENGAASQIVTFELLSEAQQATVEAMQDTWQDYKDAATDMFDTLSDEAEITVGEMADNMEENQRVISEWADNIAELAERGIDEGLLEELRQAGPESAGQVNAMVNASDEELERLSTVFAEGGDVAVDALSTSLDVDIDAVEHLVTGVEDALADQIKNANFESLGIDIVKGQAGGIKKGTPEAEQAARDMADGVEGAASDAFETGSPSRVFKRIGSDVADGLALGISDGTKKVTQAITRRMKKIAEDLKKPFDKLNDRFDKIGQDAMKGLNAGLKARRSQVLDTARSIANDVAATMQKALQISSPSRLMRDKIGKMIPEGIARGIKDNAKSVYREMERVAGALAMSTPEVALGTSRMAYSSGISAPRAAAPAAAAVTSKAGFDARAKQSAYISLILGGTEYRAFVEDITRAQDRTKLTLEAFGGVSG